MVVKKNNINSKYKILPFPTPWRFLKCESFTDVLADLKSEKPIVTTIDNHNSGISEIKNNMESGYIKFLNGNSVFWGRFSITCGFSHSHENQKDLIEFRKKEIENPDNDDLYKGERWRGYTFGGQAEPTEEYELWLYKHEWFLSLIRFYDANGKLLNIRFMQPFISRERNYTLMPLLNGNVLSWSYNRSNIFIWSQEGELLNNTEIETDEMQSLDQDGGIAGVSELDNGDILTWSSAPANLVCLWDSNGKLLRKLEGHEGSLTKAKKVSKNYIHSCSQDSTLRIWNLDDNTVKIFKDHRSGITDFMELQSGRFLTESGDGTYILWSKEGDTLAVYSSLERRQLLHNETFDILLDFSLLIQNQNRFYRSIGYSPEEGLMLKYLEDSSYPKIKHLKPQPDALQLALVLSRQIQQISITPLDPIYITLRSSWAIDVYEALDIEIQKQVRAVQITDNNLKNMMASSLNDFECF